VIYRVDDNGRRIEVVVIEHRFEVYRPRRRRELRMTSVTPPRFVAVTAGGELSSLSAAGTIHP
jgi:hypothetical protein